MKPKDMKRWTKREDIADTAGFSCIARSGGHYRPGGSGNGVGTVSRTVEKALCPRSGKTLARRVCTGDADSRTI
jgi:hypothetical protein